MPRVARITQQAHEMNNGSRQPEEPEMERLERMLGLREQPPRPVSSGLIPLTGREVEVLVLIACGRSNQQIADELVISLNTVARHVSNIFCKTGAANRAAAAVLAARRGLV